MKEFWNHWFEEDEKFQNDLFGPLAKAAYRNDPRGLLFLLARYKFCAKMLADKQHVLEIGCGDAAGIPLLLQNVQCVTGIDMNQRIIEDDMQRFAHEPRVTFHCAQVGDSSNISSFVPDTVFDGALACDVIEHIPKENEVQFLYELARPLKQDAVCIIGTPNITSAQYANSINQKEHINLQSHTSLKKLMKTVFSNVFIFSMNDELVHTGFYPMAHYLFAMGVGKHE